jgi:diguanylate cyclase (GGDEF)-like protein/PAS domain S-box-containing protein
MLVADLKGRIVWANSQTERLFGYALAELIGQPVELLIPEGAREAHVAKRDGYARQPAYRDMSAARELNGRRKDGSEFPAEIRLSPQETEDGQRIISTVRDISERKRAIQALRDSEQRWQFALEGARDGVWDWNLVTNEVFFSRQWKQMLGYEEHEIADLLEEWDKRVHPEDKACAYADIEKHLKGETLYYQNEHRLLCKDGTYKWILDRGMVVGRDAGGKPTRLIGTHTDITGRKQAEETIRELSLVDDLTGLRNRRGFFVLGESQLSLARRLGRMAVLYFVDVDGLKQINDELGHAQGDRAIADIADILCAVFSETDVIARLGGDEFVVLALESPDVDTAAAVSRLEEQFNQFNNTVHRSYRLAASTGVAVHRPESGESLTELLGRADADMYQVKQRRHGRGMVD